MEIKLVKSVKGVRDAWVFLHGGSSAVHKDQWYKEYYQEALKDGGLFIQTPRGKKLATWDCIITKVGNVFEIVK